MCESKPAPRCDLHSYQDRSKALASLTAFEKAYENTKEPTDVQTRELKRKKDIYSKRDWEFSVACANKTVFNRSTKTVEATEKVATPDEKIVRSRLVVARVKELKEKKEWEKARREFIIRKALHAYLNGNVPLAKAFVGANDRRNRNLIVDAFELLSTLPSNLGGRPLTPYELKVVADTKNSPVRNSPDYLPKDFTLLKPVKPAPTVVKKTAPVITQPKVLGNPLPAIKIPTTVLKPATPLPSLPAPPVRTTEQVKPKPPFPQINKPAPIVKPSAPAVVLAPRRGGTPIHRVEPPKPKANVMEWLKRK